MTDRCNGGSDRFEEARDVLLEANLPHTDYYGLIDQLDALEEHGYSGDMNLEPDLRVDDVVFALGVHVGYQCGLQEAERDLNGGEAGE